MTDPSLLDTFVEEWFQNENWWFHSTPEIDTYLSQKYIQLLDLCIIDNTINNLNTNTIVGSIIDHKIYSANYKPNSTLLKEIIVFDQLPRHIFRNTLSNHIITYYLQFALDRANRLNQNNLNPKEWCFALLPYRHTNDSKLILNVIEKTWKKLIESNGDPIIHKFIKATYERFPVNDQSMFIIEIVNNIYNNLEHQKTLYYCPIYLLENDKFNINDIIVSQVIDALTLLSKPNVILMSLSGGSDSMILFYILHHLKETYTFDLKVVSISYCNRESSYDEEYFVTCWANSLGYPVYVRRIEEIKRDMCREYDLRNIYESYTRNVRYSCYKTIGKKNNYYVALGHNKDDCLENIFQNISNKSKYENLDGMSKLSLQDDIQFFRPLLDIPKDSIVQYAIKNNIPFLPSSTPSWSQRGRIRNEVKPCLDSWNPQFVPGLHELSKAVSSLHHLAHLKVTDIINKFKKIELMSDTCKIFEAYKASLSIEDLQNELLWNMLLREMFPHVWVKTKSIRSFMQRLPKILSDSNNEPTKVNFAKNLQLHIHVPIFTFHLLN